MPAEEAITSLVLDAPLPAAGQDRGRSGTRPRALPGQQGQVPDLHRAFATLDLDPSERPAAAKLERDLDEQLQRAATRAFRDAFLVGAAPRAPGHGHGRSPPPADQRAGQAMTDRRYQASLPVVALALVSGLLAVQLSHGGGRFEPLESADPCVARTVTSQSEGIEGLSERLVLLGLDGAACRLGLSREALTLELAQPGPRSDAEIEALHQGLLDAVQRMKDDGSLPPASDLVDEALDATDLNGFLKAAIRALPDSVVNAALKTDDILTRTIDDLDLREPPGQRRQPARSQPTGGRRGHRSGQGIPRRPPPRADLNQRAPSRHTGAVQGRRLPWRRHAHRHRRLVPVLRRLRRPTAALGAVLLVPALAACGDDSGKGLRQPTRSRSRRPRRARPAPAAVREVTFSGEVGESLTATWHSELEAPTSTTVTTLVAGDGDKVADGDTVSAYLYLGDGTTQQDAYSDYTNGSPESIPVDDQLGDVFTKLLADATYGSRVVAVTSASELFGDAGNEQLGIDADRQPGAGRRRGGEGRGRAHAHRRRGARRLARHAAEGGREGRHPHRPGLDGDRRADARHPGPARRPQGGHGRGREGVRHRHRELPR